MTACGVALVLGAGTDQLPVFEAARSRGLQVATADPDPSAPGLDLADHTLVADLADKDACIDFATSLNPACVLTFAADFPVPMVSALAAHLGLPGLSPMAAAAATDKLLMRQRLADFGVPMPFWEHVSTIEEAEAAARRIGGAVVVKPRRSSGSRGVVAVGPRSTGELAQALHAASAVDSADGVLIEELVAGPEVSIEAVWVAGELTVLTRTDKLTTGPPHFVEVGHSQPAALDSYQQTSIELLLLRTLRALGFEDCVTHAEFRVTPVGPVVLEVAARAAGGMIGSDLALLSAKLDVAEIALALALGERPVIEPISSGGAAVRFFTPPPGLVAKVSGVGRAGDMPGVTRVEIHVEPGTRIEPLNDARQRVGRVVASGCDAPTAAQRAEDAVACVEFEIAS